MREHDEIKEDRVNLGSTKCSYVTYLVDKQSGLPEYVVTSASIDMLKNKLDCHLSELGIYRY